MSLASEILEAVSPTQADNYLAQLIRKELSNSGSIQELDEMSKKALKASLMASAGSIVNERLRLQVLKFINSRFDRGS